MVYRTAVAALGLSTTTLMLGCSGSSENANPISEASGGNTEASGGSGAKTNPVATGGRASTTATPAGGSASAGDPVSSGGATTSGGATASGGLATGGSVAVGGTAATGGAKATGGFLGMGGATTSGGAASSGGTKATGGGAAVGGTVASGGASAGGTSTGGTATAGSVATGGTTGVVPSTIPTATEACPTLVTGMVSFLGSSVSLSVGPANTKGPLLFYWHATGMTFTEVQTGFGDVIAEVKSKGGVVASFTTTTSSGTNTGNGVWYTGDIDVADEVLACAIQQGLVDPSRIHVSGYSAGGLQCAAMSYLRSGYVASVLCMSGGFMSTLSSYSLQDASHVPAAIAAHGAPGSDVFILDFATCSNNYCSSVASKGGLAVNCNDGGDHLGSMASRARTMAPVAWKFFAENQYGANNHYSGGLPSYFPSYCVIAQ